MKKNTYKILLFLFLLTCNSCFFYNISDNRYYDDRIKKEAKQQLNYNKLINIEIEQLDTIKYFEETEYRFPYYQLKIILKIENIYEKDIYLVENHFLRSFENQFKPNIKFYNISNLKKMTGRPDSKFYYYKISPHEKIVLDTLRFENRYENIFSEKEFYLTFKWLILNEKFEILSLNRKKNFWQDSSDSIVSNTIILK